MMVEVPPEDGIPKSIPEPASVMTCGLFAAVSVRVMVPVRVPEEVGVKVTWMAHVPPLGATHFR